MILAPQCQNSAVFLLPWRQLLPPQRRICAPPTKSLTFSTQPPAHPIPLAMSLSPWPHPSSRSISTPPRYLTVPTHQAQSTLFRTSIVCVLNNHALLSISVFHQVHRVPPPLPLNCSTYSTCAAVPQLLRAVESPVGVPQLVFLERRPLRKLTS